MVVFPPRPSEEAVRSLFVALMGSIVKSGRLVIVGHDGAAREIGDGTGPRLALKLNDRRVAWDIFRNP